MVDFAGSETFRADIHLLGIAAVDLHADALNVGIPDAVGSSMRMADVVTEMSALSTDFTLCHDHTSYLTSFDRLTAQGFIYAHLCRYRRKHVPESGSSIRSTRPLLQSVLYVFVFENQQHSYIIRGFLELQAFVAGGSTFVVCFTRLCQPDFRTCTLRWHWKLV